MAYCCFLFSSSGTTGSYLSIDRGRRACLSLFKLYMLLYSIVNELEKKNTKCLDVGIWCFISMYIYVFFFPILSFLCPFFFFEAYPYTARLLLVVAAPVTFLWPSTLSSSIQTPKGLFLLPNMVTDWIKMMTSVLCHKKPGVKNELLVL